MVRTRTRLSQIPVTRETAAVGTVSRSDTWETQGTARNERWVKDGCQHRHVLESLCKVLSAVAPHTPQKAMPCRSHGSFLDHAPPSTNRFTCCSLWPLYFDRLVPVWIVLHFNLVHCASLAERVVFIAVDCASVAKGVFFCAAPPLCSIPRRLLSHKLFLSVVMSGQHGGAKLGSTLPFAEAAGPATLCTTVDVTFPRPPSEHKARDVQWLKRLTPSLLPRFPVGWCTHWKELALWLRQDGCQVSFDDVASRVEARGAVDVR